MNSRTTTRVVCVLACVAFLADQSRAQPSAFAAADVHQSDASVSTSMRVSLGSGYYRLHSATMLDLIMIAFGVDEEKIVGGPVWLNTDRFDVSFKVPAEATRQTVRPVLRDLLAERFHLVTHSDVAAFPEYSLTATKRVRLKRALGNDDADCRMQGTPPNSVLFCHNMSITAFASELPQLAPGYFQGGPLVDRSALPGEWNFTLKWTERNLLPTVGAEGTSIYDALENQLGLKVEIGKSPMPVVAVDSVARIPTPNLPDINQAWPPALTRFEVASIKLSSPDSMEAKIRRVAGWGVELRGFTLRRLIKFAWDFQDMDVRDNDEMLSGPKSPGAQRFDIVAKAPVAGVSPEELTRPLDPDIFRGMLRTLLSERFGLETHNDTRPVPVYVMTADHPGLKRASASSRSGCRQGPPTRITSSTPLFSLVCRSTTMPQLAKSLQGIGGIYILHPVVDATGLKGAWDFSLSWSPAHLLEGCSGCNSAAGLVAATKSAAAGPSASISIVEALQRQLGLKLKLQKQPMPVLVVDHVDEKPSEN